MAQRQHGARPYYELVGTVGPAHEQTFTVAAVLDGRRLATGSGSSRQRAEEQAAGSALEALLFGGNDQGPPDAEAPAAGSPE